jgi:hypothetical protein
LHLSGEVISDSRRRPGTLDALSLIGTLAWAKRLGKRKILNRSGLAMNRRAKFLWMKEILEHLDECHRQWQYADDQTERYLAEAMKRDLEEVRRLCDSLHSQPARASRIQAFAAA